MICSIRNLLNFFSEQFIFFSKNGGHKKYLDKKWEVCTYMR